MGRYFPGTLPAAVDAAFKAREGQQQKPERRLCCQAPCQRGKPLQARPQSFKCEGFFFLRARFLTKMFKTETKLAFA